MNALRVASTLAATTATGLLAGTFALYAHTIMPALRTVDDRTFVIAFRALDTAIVNPWFLAGAFLGAGFGTLVALLANLGQRALPWIAAALALYAVALVVTIAVHLPLNDAVKAATFQDRAPDLAAVRALLHESRWAAWNLVRVAASTGAFGLLGWSLVLVGRSTAGR